MKNTTITVIMAATILIAGCGKQLPSASTNALTTTNAPHFSSKFAERLHQIRERDATNKAPDHLTSPKFVQQQIQQSQPIKRPVVLLPPMPPEPTK